MCTGADDGMSWGEPEPQKWPCRICGKMIEHPDFFMETTLCEGCKKELNKPWTAAEIELAKEQGRKLAEFFKVEE